MPFLAPATIPTINYSTYNSYQPTPPVENILHDRVYDEHTAMKVALRNLLKQNKLSYTPYGFPFHTVPREYAKSGQSKPEISYASYEFKQPFCTSERHSRIQHATFTFTAPDFRRGMSMMTWTVSIPGRRPAYDWDHSDNVAIARVQIDPIIMETSFGIDVMTNPRIILEAMALSIELGILITVQVANRKTPSKTYSKRNIIYDPGEIIFLATDKDGGSEVVFVFC